MEKEKFRYEIIKSMVKTTHNDYELGQKVRNFFREEEQLDGEIDLKKYNTNPGSRKKKSFF